MNFTDLKLIFAQGFFGKSFSENNIPTSSNILPPPPDDDDDDDDAMIDGDDDDDDKAVLRGWLVGL